MVEKSKLLIVTGPQGSGNHLFAKLFNLHPDVYGWDMEKYWVGHHTEPFSEYWTDPYKLKYFNWEQSNYYVTSISCPYFKFKNPQIPKYKQFITTIKKYCNVSIVIIGRDQTILKHEQNRVRKKHTTPLALKEFKYLYNLDPYFISMELVFLYKENYLQQIGRDLHFPITQNIDKIKEVLCDESNKKYIHKIGKQLLDLEIYQSSNVDS